jgi:hypothetical protein
MRKENGCKAARADPPEAFPAPSGDMRPVPSEE